MSVLKFKWKIQAFLFVIIEDEEKTKDDRIDESKSTKKCWYTLCV